jgi:hypothetical protein
LRMILFRLREALELVESCGRRPAFDDADKRINNYLIELSSGSGASIEKKIDRLARGPVASQDHQQTSGKITIFFFLQNPSDSTPISSSPGGSAWMHEEVVLAANEMEHPVHRVP